jgi:hypothetical protein
VVQIFEDGHDGVVVQTSDAAFGCSLSEGAVRWAASIPQGRGSTRDGRMWIVAASAASQSLRLVCLELLAGYVAYDVAHEVDLMDPWPPALGEREVACCSPSGWVVAFRLSDGSLVASYKYKSGVYTPIFADHRLLVPAADGMLLALEGLPA